MLAYTVCEAFTKIRQKDLCFLFVTVVFTTSHQGLSFQVRDRILQRFQNYVQS